jgi:hypothetical protein
MANTIGINPSLTTNVVGSFSVQSNGFYQGEMLDDPAGRFSISTGALATTETLPMWAGVAIYEAIPTGGDSVLGSTIGRALSAANIAGFSILNQGSNGITTPQSSAPMFSAGMTVPYVRYGSENRVAVQCSAALASLDGGMSNQLVGWDLTNQQLIPYQTMAATLAITGLTWSGGVVSVTTTSAHGVSTGAYVTIAGAAPAGYNGVYQVTVTSTTTFTYLLATNPGSETTFGTAGAASAALPVKVLQILTGNSKTIVYDSVNNFANFTPTGNAALILI